MKEDKDLGLKEQFKELVKQVKFHKKRPEGGDYRNEEVAADMGFELPYFNSLVGTNGKVTEKHINKIKGIYPDIFLTNSNNLQEVALKPTVESLSRSIEKSNDARLIEADNIRRLITLLEKSVGVPASQTPFKDLRTAGVKDKASSRKQ